MMNKITDLITTLTTYADETLWIIGACYLINLINWFLFASLLNIFGITPRTLHGLLGVFFYPILHGNTQHFLSNALPFFLLTITGLSLVNQSTFLAVVLLSHFLTAAGIWFFARRAIHIGASGLVSSLYGWLLTLTISEPSLINLTILFLIFVYMGGILLGLMPQEENVSWEGHLIGFISGVLVYFYAKTPDFYMIEVKTMNLISSALSIVS